MNRVASSGHDVDIVNRNPFGQRAAAVNGIAKCGPSHPMLWARIHAGEGTVVPLTGLATVTKAG